jgi:hypothetical protein
MYAFELLVQMFARHFWAACCHRLTLRCASHITDDSLLFGAQRKNGAMSQEEENLLVNMSQVTGTLAVLAQC